LVQLDCADVAVNCPETQLEQVVSPIEALSDPGTQLKHFEEVVAPTVVE